jgi:hypothetical protein
VRPFSAKAPALGYEHGSGTIVATTVALVLTPFSLVVPQGNQHRSKDWEWNRSFVLRRLLLAAFSFCVSGDT